MGKPTGFMEYKRVNCLAEDPKTRVQHFNEFHTLLPLEERRVQGARCMDCGVPFCQSGFTFQGRRLGCPLHNLIPEWNDMIMLGNAGHAQARLLKTNNFPEFTGRVCPAPCETACTCGLVGESVTIRDNELGIIEDAFASGAMQPRIPPVRSDKRVAVVGSGPAGLACADQLNQRGHTVTVLEKEDRIGGLLMYGIPNMKLPKEIVDRRVALMAAEGVLFRTGMDVGRTVTAEALREEYDCVVLCCGAGEPRTDAVLRPEIRGIYYAMDYLRAATKKLLGISWKSIDAAGKHVLVIGAGDTATDCVATAIRQGCKSVRQLIRRPRSSYGEIKTDYAQEEAMALFGADPRQFETVVKEVLTDKNGRVRAVKAQVSGEREERMGAELILLATGFSGCEPYVLEAFGLDKGEAPEGVFVAGDMRMGASLVVTAIADGRKAARAADLYLMGYTNMQP